MLLSSKVIMLKGISAPVSGSTSTVFQVPARLHPLQRSREAHPSVHVPIRRITAMLLVAACLCTERGADRASTVSTCPERIRSSSRLEAKYPKRASRCQWWQVPRYLACSEARSYTRLKSEEAVHAGSGILV